MPLLKNPVPLACLAVLTALSAAPSRAAAGPEQALLLAQYEDVGQLSGEPLAPAALMPATVAEGLDQSFDDTRVDQGDLWDRIRKGFAIQELNNPLVANHSFWFGARPEGVQRTAQRASRYLFHVVQELEKRQMPTELALLPFIESGFNPQAYSHAKAAGMWQFIPSTGRSFNLKQNAFRDDRRDVLASTDAALTYLQRLHGMFGDWQLALAAYNWGEGSVMRAISRAKAAGRPIDYNGLSVYMPAETRNYYPKLQALKNVIASPSRFGVKLPPVENKPYFVTVKKTRDIDLNLAAELAELPMEEFKALNPQFNSPVITGSPDTQILLPTPNAEKFRENLKNWTQALSSWTAHKVTMARERIESIAARFQTTPQVIRSANAIPANMQPKAGSTLVVPKTTLSNDANIGQDITENAVLALEPDYFAFRPAQRAVTKKPPTVSPYARATQRQASARK